ncbi:MAG TPA: AAA family ATPase [Thermoanaerobaculia bacterium]|nr:AAA family ATPase [Thermoanaerobaculia bacterium]
MQLLEREGELAAFERLLRGAGAGRGALVSISGEAGAGKTTLVEEYARRSDPDARVLWSACEALTTPRPLGPLHDLARQVRGDLSEALRSGAHRSVLFATAMDELTRIRPTIVIIEDVHWADDATLDLIKFLGRRIARASMLLLLTWRDSEVEAAHPLRATLADIPVAHLTRIALRPFTKETVARLAAAAGRDDAATLFSLTAGNPFYLTEVLVHGQEPVPESVRDAIQARVLRLPPESRRIVELASVVPGHVEEWLLEALASSGEAVEACCASGILVRGRGALQFRHELARLAIEQNLDTVHRAALHRDVLQALEESVEPARLAHHAAAAGDADAAFRHSLAAAERAAALRAHRAAAEHYEMALRYGRRIAPRQRADLLERFADEMQIIGRIEEGAEAVRTALEIWKREGDPLRAGRATRISSRYAWLRRRRGEAEALADEAIAMLEALPPGPELAMAYSTRSQLEMLDDNCEAAIAIGNRAIELAERFETREILIHALCNVGAAEMVIGFADEGRSKLRRSAVLALEDGFDEHACRVWACLISTEAKCRRFEEARTVWEQALPFCAQRDLDPWLHYILGWKAQVLLDFGRWDEAAADAASILARPGASTVFEVVALFVTARLAVRRCASEAKDLLLRSRDVALEMDEVQRLIPYAAARLEHVWLHGGEHDLSDVEQIYRRAIERPNPWYAGEMAWLLWRVGRVDNPPDICAEPYALAIRGEWRRAAATWEEIGCPWEQALTLFDGDAESRQKGIAILERIGAIEAADLMRRRYGIPRRRGRSKSRQANAAGVTSRQLDVLTLLAEGLTNAQIAGRLGIASRTVDHHVSSILTTLGASSRTEAVVAAVRQGWLRGQT